MAGKSPLKQIVDNALAPAMSRMEREVKRLQVISAGLVALREAICRPTPASARPADAAECAVVMRQYAVWCGRRGGCPNRSLIRLMLISMSSDTPAVDSDLAKLQAKTSYAPPSKEDRDAA